MTEASMKKKNLELFQHEFHARQACIDALPVQIDFETTSRCNLRCFTCTKSYSNEKGTDSSPELFDRVADDLFDTATSINLTGYGEPMLSKHFKRFFERAVASDLDVGFVTNGTLLDEHWIETFCAHRVHMIVSVDTTNPETMATMRPGLKWDRLMELLRFWRSVQERQPEQKARLNFNFVPTQLNIQDLPSVVELASEVGARRVEVLNYWIDQLPSEVNRMSIVHNLDFAVQCFSKARERADALGVDLILPSGYEAPGGDPDSTQTEDLDQGDAPVEINPPGSKYPLACSAPWFRVSIYANGDVRPCCWYPWALGNLNNNSFQEIWNGNAYQQMRRRINSRFPHLGCKTCRLTWGITAGQPDAIFSQEQGIDDLHTKLQRLRRWWGNARRTKSCSGATASSLEF